MTNTSSLGPAPMKKLNLKRRNILSFKEFLMENQLDVGNNNEFNKDDEFNKNKLQIKIIGKVNDYEVGFYKGIFYLIKENKYISYIENYEEKIKNKTINISSAHAKERGTYYILMMFLVQKYNIVSDTMLSTSAKNYWLKLINNKSLTKIIVDYNENIVFTGKEFSNIEMDLFKNPEYRVGLLKQKV